MKNKEIVSINKMIKYIDKALKYTESIDFEKFQNNEEKQDATIFAISQIGELVKNIEEDTQKIYPEVEWIIIKNLRNKIVHDYDGINLKIIWDIIENDLNPLKINLLKIVETTDKEN